MPAVGQSIKRPAAGSPITLYHEHMGKLERQRILEERRRMRAGWSAPSGTGPSHGGKGRPQHKDAGADAFKEEGEHGTIESVDEKRHCGQVRNDLVGSVTFYLEQCEFGMRRVRVGEQVTFRLDTYRTRPVAVEVRPVAVTAIKDDDVDWFVKVCSAAQSPVMVMRRALMACNDWQPFMAAVRQAGRLAELAVALIRVSTAAYPPGRGNPIDIRIISAFLSMLAASESNFIASASIKVFPDLISELLQRSSACSQQDDAPRDALQGEADTEAQTPAEKAEEPLNFTFLEKVNLWMEVSELVLLYRRFTSLSDSEIAKVSEPLIALAEDALGHLGDSGDSLTRRRLEQVVRRSSSATAAFLRTALIPSEEELSLPTWNTASPMNPANLPVATTTEWTDELAYVADHCRLLRADSFSATVNIIGYKMFPGIAAFRQDTPSGVLTDCGYTPFFCDLEFLGLFLVRDGDLRQPTGYAFRLAEAIDLNEERPVRWGSVLEPGALICITTGTDRSVIDPNEIFWATVSTSDDVLRYHRCVVLHPVRGCFRRLLANIERNRERGIQATHTLMAQTRVFFTGYASVMEGLLSFLGPGAMKVPFTDILLTEPPIGLLEEAVESSKSLSERAAHHSGLKAAKLALERRRQTSSAPSAGANRNIRQNYDNWHIPPFAIGAFEQLIWNTRLVNNLDCGQDGAMKELSKRQILLVQGPPGTGKSFIGCRIVETLVRYKQLLASGNILSCLDVEHLPSSSLSTIAPGPGASNHVGPIVVITFKNHALDEFLLDLRNSGLWDAERTRFDASAGTFPRGCRMVRVGDRSQEEALFPFKLTSLFAGSHTAKTKQAPYRDKIRTIVAQLERISREVSILESGLIPEKVFRELLTPQQRETITSAADIRSWMLGERYIGEALTKEEQGPGDYYKRLLRPPMADVLHADAAEMRRAAAPATSNPDEEQPGTVFGDIERELRGQYMKEVDDTHAPADRSVCRLSPTALSARAIRLANEPPRPPASSCLPGGLTSLWALAPRARHEYLAYLSQLAIVPRARRYLMLHDQLRTLVSLRMHAGDEARLELLRQADVIGLTTTGCAMHQGLLRALRPRVLIVEEAAEVLESQLLACMTDSLAQVVLIGDHYQLRPKVETYELDVFNRFNTSLFERLAHIISPLLLVDQRRMRPGISRLIRPFYAPVGGLQDHPSVCRDFIDAAGYKHKDVPGLRYDAFFWSHDCEEETAEVGLSKINRHEIKLVLVLVRHLLSEGVPPTSITVITPYLGQRRALAYELLTEGSNTAARSVRVSTVDMFQGDENDIIILSLVRTRKLTEFMRMRNRMIVSCSRARHAMVLIGSESLLAQSPHWAQVLDILNASGCVGTDLPVTVGAQNGVLLQDGTVIRVH